MLFRSRPSSTLNSFLSQASLAGVPGFEPGLSVLETDVLTVDTIPLGRKDAGMWRMGDTEKRPFRRVSASPVLRVRYSLGFLMASVLPATATEFLELEPIGRRLLVFRRYVIAALAFTTLEHNVIAWHNLTSFHFQLPLPISNLRAQI